MTDKFRDIGEALGKFGEQEIGEIISGMADRNCKAVLMWLNEFAFTDTDGVIHLTE